MMYSYPIILKSKSEEIRLENHMLPAPPLSFTTGIKIKKNEYPGNPEPTVQVLGVSYPQSIEIGGTFKDWQAKEDGFAERMRTTLQTFKDKGEETVFQYASQIFIGMVEELTFNTHNIREIEYKLRFNVFTMDLRKNTKKIAGLPDVNKLTKKASALKDLVDKAQNLNNKIVNIHNSIWSYISELKEKTGLNDINQLINLSRMSANEINTMISELRRLRPQNFIDIQGLQEIQKSAMDLRQENTNYLTAANTQMNGNRKYIVYIVAQGDTLMSVSSKFYGAPDAWGPIAIENKLSTTQLTLGQKLVIPL